jgi:hypothetical protein
MGDKRKRGRKVAPYCQVMWQVVSTCRSCSFLCCFSRTHHSHHAHVIPILKVLYLGVSDLSQFTLGMGNDSEAVYNKEGAVRGLKRAPCNATDRFGPTRRAGTTANGIGTWIGSHCVLGAMWRRDLGEMRRGNNAK